MKPRSKEIVVVKAEAHDVMNKVARKSRSFWSRNPVPSDPSPWENSRISFKRKYIPLSRRGLVGSVLAY